MITFLLILSVLLFMAYFYAIWLWYLWIIPLLLCILLFALSIGGLWKKEKANSLFSSYWLYFAWVLILIWLFLILKFFGWETITSCLFLLLLNVLFLVGSYIFKYNDWKIVSHIWFSFIALLMIIYMWIVNWFEVCLDTFSYVWCLYLWVVAFIVFIFSLWLDIEKYMHYLLFVLLGGAIVIMLYNLITNIYVFLIALCVWLAGVYFFIDYVLMHKPPTQTQVKEISVRRILAWERVLQKIPQHNDFFKSVYDFVYEMPQLVKYILEFANTLIIVVLIYLYFVNALSLKWSLEQLFYWVIMFGFILNVYLLKKIEYTSIVQRFFTYLVINFAIYISLFAGFAGDVWNIVIWWIVRNLASSAIIFRIHKTKIGFYLKKIDYLFWIFTTILAMIVNIILLISTWMSAKLMFPIMLLYVWVQCMLLYYSLKFVHRIQEIEENE